MEFHSSEYDYNDFLKGATGSIEGDEDYKIVSCPFGKYEVKLKLSPNNEFIEIVEIGINREFLTQKQKIDIQSYHDVEKFYTED